MYVLDWVSLYSNFIKYIKWFDFSSRVAGGFFCEGVNGECCGVRAWGEGVLEDD